MNKFYLTLLLLGILLSFNGQPPLPGGPSSNCWPPPCIPVDGGISLFTFLSIFFGYKFLSKNKQSID